MIFPTPDSRLVCQPMYETVSALNNFPRFHPKKSENSFNGQQTKTGVNGAQRSGGRAKTGRKGDFLNGALVDRNKNSISCCQLHQNAKMNVLQVNEGWRVGTWTSTGCLRRFSWAAKLSRFVPFAVGDASSLPSA